jgi:putative ABC transport system substrate-binding protein
MQRRDFITLLGVVAATWPLTARAQPTERMRRVSVLMAYVESDPDAHQWAKAFSESLQELGWINGRNVQLDIHWAGPSPDRVRADAAEMVRLNPDVLMAAATPSVVALQHETRSIQLYLRTSPIPLAKVSSPPLQSRVATLPDLARLNFR